MNNTGNDDAQALRFAEMEHRFPGALDDFNSPATKPYASKLIEGKLIGQWWITLGNHSPQRHREHGGCTEEFRLGHYLMPSILLEVTIKQLS